MNVNRTSGDRWVLYRYIVQDSEELQHVDCPTRAVVKLEAAVNSGAVVPSERTPAVLQDATNEFAVDVVTIIKGDGFISYGPVSMGPGHSISVI